MQRPLLKRIFIGGTLFASVIALALSANLLASLAAGKTCPISGKPAKDGITLNVNGKDIGFCCNNCPKTYEKKYLVTDDGVKNCPISGKPAKESSSLIHMTAEKVAFCCKNCPKKFAKKNNFEFVDKGPKNCPISGKPAKESAKIVVNGENIYFCCNGCPKKYLAGLNLKKGEPTKCPISGQGIKKDTEMVFVTSKKVYFCCDNCPKKYAADNIKSQSDKNEDKDKDKKKDKKKKKTEDL